MGEEEKRLRFEIDGVWTSEDFIEFFEQVEFLNQAASFGLYLERPQGHVSMFGFARPYRQDRMWSNDFEREAAFDNFILQRQMVDFMRGVVPIRELRVRRMEFASPGLVDVAGIGKVVGHLTKFVLAVTDRFLHREDRELIREEKRQKILKDKIANAERLLKLGDKANLDSDTKSLMVRRVLEADTYLERALIQQRITDIKPLD